MFVATKENFELKLLFSNAAMPLCHLCCCGSVLFRVHESVNNVSDFMFKVGGNSVSRGMGEIIPSQKLCNVWPISYK